MKSITLAVLLWSNLAGALEPHFVSRAGDQELPRAASWCASLLRFGPAEAPEKNVVFKQRVVGDAAIRAYLGQIERTARTLDDEYAAERARELPVTRANRLSRAVQSVMALVTTGSLIAIDAGLVHHGHYVWAAGVLGAIAWTARELLIPAARGVFYDVRNGAWRRRVRREGPGAFAGTRLVTAGSLGTRAGPDFARDVLAQLDREPAARVALDRSYALALPLSLSMTPFSREHRRPPTGGEIVAALTRSGEAPLPADYRRLRVDHLFYQDLGRGEPVLWTRVLEERHPSDWIFP